jgi:hypothetical protein
VEATSDAAKPVPSNATNSAIRAIHTDGVERRLQAVRTECLTVFTAAKLTYAATKNVSGN